MTVFITAADLTISPGGENISADWAEAMITDTVAKAALVAPCILRPDFAENEWKMAALKAILRTAILRWADAGSGALSSYSVSAGPFSQSESFDNRQYRRAMFWPTEIIDLRKLCLTTEPGDAYMVDMTGLADRPNPLEGVTINADPGYEPMGRWADDS